MILAAFLLLAAFFALYIAMPFFEDGYRRRKLEFSDSKKENLTHSKDEILEAIRDLEYDYKMQKMTEQDYLLLKESLTKEAVEIMKQLDSLEKGSNLDANGQHEQQHSKTGV